ncbi:unnamed protein product [Aphanomyces euteiches]|uniref:DUF4604 domain-containing protein n=1 Tax=Aphanomyces euteiches TaxID=100861 RepID=A0A6G0X429_9STRA|nr:hypothetical protein Ae201684_008743 [Aphanomyces euteiches]KAH9085550.1 hypothetical protein Ae201684P_005256 [Aphanomyces euteiches]KAH9138918.1 hypothetical protein AeRB84_016808 [Aphanomyces euteiches]
MKGKDDNSWRNHESFQHIDEETAQDSKRGRGGPEFTRVIPKFLQKYHNPVTLDHEASLALKRPPTEQAQEDDEDELDEVQKEALRAYEEEQARGKEETEETKKDDNEDEAPAKSAHKRKAMTFSSSKKDTQATTTETKASQPPKKARKTLDNKKLLSFSIDDD